MMSEHDNVVDNIRQLFIRDLLFRERWHNTRVGCGAWTEINSAVRTNCRAIRVVIAHAGQMLDERRHLSVMRDFEDAAAFKLTAFGDIEGAFGIRDPSPRAIVM